MSKRSATDFTGIAIDAKNSLDEVFRIQTKEDALAIINEMAKRNNKIGASSLGDLDERLLAILENDKKYMSENFNVLSGEKKVVKSLFENDYSDFDKNAEIIEKYRSYIMGLKISRVDLDKKFLDKLDKVHSEYKSSKDYMERLVNRLLKYNFGYSEECLEGVGTRVLILRQFLDVYGYNCVEEISSPGLEKIVQKEFKGKAENITDEIFKYLDGDEHIKALVRFQGIIIYKSSTIQMTSTLCKSLCSLICEEKILTSCAEDGTATLLKDCFYEPEKFDLNYIKDANVDNIIDLTNELNKLYKAGKREKRESFSDIDESIRLGIFFSEFLSKVETSESFISLFPKAFPDMELQMDAGPGKCISERDLKIIKSIKQSNIKKDEAKLNCIRELLDECEKLLCETDKEKYQSSLYQKIGERYNGAVNPSKNDGLYKKANELFSKKTDYKLLNIANVLANAKFSPHGKTREYLYIFAIAFGMTSTGYSDDYLGSGGTTGEDVLKTDPRKITDIQKNLFFDYYSDNIANNLNSVKGFNNEKVNISVDGYAINYKNFAEITFLWCINQDSLEKKEKLQLAYNIIENCRKDKDAKSEEDFNAEIDSKDERTTQKYKEYYGDKVIKINDKDTFQAFLIKNYPCKNPNGNIMQINANGIAAGEVLERQKQRVTELLEEVEQAMFADWSATEVIDRLCNNDNSKLLILRHYLRNFKCKDCERRNGGMFPNCKSYFEQYSWTDTKGKINTISSCGDFYSDKECDFETLRKSLKDFVYLGDEYESDFKNRLSHVSELCGKKQINLKKVLEKIEKRINKNVLYLDKKDVSRTALIVLCYFEMVFMNYLYRSYCEGKDKSFNVKTFEDFYNIFCEGRTICIEKYNEVSGEYDSEKTFFYPGANKILEEAGYQKINSKNMLDIYVIFLAFKDNYREIYRLPSAEDFIQIADKTKENLELIEKEIRENREK